MSLKHVLSSDLRSSIDLQKTEYIQIMQSKNWALEGILTRNLQRGEATITIS